ncbi:hypothetical protein KJ940_21430, partial [Myxococcota bacterium]|nr:hypothetical protein [Myxococcota bacterium]
VGGGGDAGSGGGETPSCVLDEECPQGQYCAPDGAGCVDGCRVGAADTCGDGQHCDPISHACVDGPAACVEGEDTCGPGTWCSGGFCLPSECDNDLGCSGLTEDGRAQMCDMQTHTCVALYACCDANNACDMVAEGAACSGSLLMNRLECTDDACGPICEGDAGCADTAFCDEIDGRCRDGCRTEPDNCPEDQVCDPDKHTCEDMPCETSGNCPTGMYCDPGFFTCRDGCDTAEQCPEGMECVNNDCVDVCMGDEDCGEGQYCSEDGACVDRCTGHDDCSANAFCDQLTGRCQEGCRDDEGEGAEPNDDMASAFLVELPARDGGSISYEVEGRRFCDSNPDFFQVDLDQAERMRVELFYAPGENLNLRLHGEAIGDTPIEAAELTIPEVIVFPADGAAPQNAATYYVEVFGEISGGLDYSLRFTIVDASDACFPDPLEEGMGNDISERAVVMADDDFPVVGSICANDEDWFSFEMYTNDGIQLEVSTSSTQAPMIIEVYSDSGLFQGLNNSAYRVDTPDERVDGNVYVISVDEQTAGFTDDTYYVRVRAASSEDIIDAYELDVRFIRGQVCRDDGFEPNNDLGSATVIEDALSLPDLLPLDAPQALENLALCPMDQDFYVVEVEEGDILEAWILGVEVAGEFNVQLRDNQGVVVGRSASLSPSADEPDMAVLRGTMAGLYYISVSGVGASEGSYELMVQRRQVPEGLCVEDVAETEGERNDTSASAQPLEDVSGGEGLKFEYTEGYLCDVEGPDEDWYRFDIAEERSRLCVTVNGFRNETADVDLEMYPAHTQADNPAGTRCQTDAFCVSPGSCAAPGDAERACGGFCIGGVCTNPVAESTSNFNNEIVDLNKNVAGTSAFGRFLRVYRNGGNSGYRITATITPERDLCARDWQERDNPNDSEMEATVLGSGQMAMCDTWICDNELVAGDWYQISIPAGQDRTVLISYAAGSDGQLELMAYNPDVPNFGGFFSSSVVDINAQCVNIRGLDVDQDLFLGVASIGGGRPRDDGDSRIDYGMRIVETNLDVNDMGACLLLGAPNLGACPSDPDDPCYFGGPSCACYPTVDLNSLL